MQNAFPLLVLGHRRSSGRSLRGVSLGRGASARLAFAIVALVLAACGGDGDGDGSRAADDASTDDLDVCALLDDSEIESLLGAVLPSEPAGADAPFPACSWQGGRLIVQVARGDSVVLAPGQECPAVDLGDEGVRCPGSVQFVTNGSRVIVQTIEDLTEAQLVDVATALLPKFDAG